MKLRKDQRHKQKENVKMQIIDVRCWVQTFDKFVHLTSFKTQILILLLLEIPVPKTKDLSARSLTITSKVVFMNHVFIIWTSIREKSENWV